MNDRKYIIRKVQELANDWYNNLDDEVFLEIEVYLDTVIFPEMSEAEIAKIAEDKDSIYYLAKEVDEIIDFENLIEQTINENGKILTEGHLINTREFINRVNNSREDYTEYIVRFFGGGGVIITLTSLIDLYVTDMDTNETVKFTTLETHPSNKYDWGWDLRDKLLDLEIILGRSNWRKELKFEDSINEQTINENEREPGREYFADLIDEMIQANWGPSVDGYWTNKIKNDSIRELRKEKLNLDIDGKGKAYVDTTRNEVNDYLEVIADVVLNVKDKYKGIPKVNKTKKSWRAADERKVGLRENMNETFYLIINTLFNEWFGINGGLDSYAIDGLDYADYAKDEVINHFIRLNKVPTEDEVIDFYINHEADLNQVMTRNREIFDNLIDEVDKNLMEEIELEVISFNKKELVKYLKSYGLDAFTEDVVEGVARHLEDELILDETLIGPDMDKLLEFEEGWIVGISAAKGEDIDIDYYNNHSLEEELTKLGLDFIGPKISMWDGSVEEGFLVNVHSNLNLERLYDLGNKYKQDWVAVWEAPLELGKTIIQVDFAENHTMLDGKAYSIVSNDISGYEATNLNEQTINEREGNNMDKLELINLISRTGMEYHEDDFDAALDIIWLYFIDTEMFTEDELTLVTYLNGYNEKTLNDILYIRFGYRDLPQYLESEVLYENKTLAKNKTLNENLQDYYQGEILGKSIILRDLLNIEFPLNALTNNLGEYLGYDEEDFTKEELDSRVIVTDIYTDADGFIGAEIKFENRDLNENTKGFTIAYPNGDFYIGKPMDLYTMMTDFLIDWDEDKTIMTEYEAENVASIRENYEEVFYAALEGGNYWKAEDFEEAFGRFSDYGIANALSINENKTLNEDVTIIDTALWGGNDLEDWARNEGWNLEHLIDLLVSEDWVWQELFDIIDGRTLTKTELNDFLRFDAEDIVLDLIGS